MTAPTFRRLSPLRLGSCVAVAAAVLSALFLAPSGDAGTAPAVGTPATEVPRPQPPQEAPAPAEGTLTLIESGSTPLRDLVGDHLLSWGGVVENTASELYAVPTVRANFTVGDETVELESPLGTIAPGAKSAVGSTDYIPDGKLGEVTISVVAVRWVDTLGANLAVTVNEVEGTWVGAGETANYLSSEGISFPVDERGDLVLAFRVESRAAVMIGRPTYVALFRDTEGRVLGAYSELTFDEMLPPGWCLRDFRVRYGPPDATADDGVEVHVLVP